MSAVDAARCSFIISVDFSAALRSLHSDQPSPFTADPRTRRRLVRRVIVGMSAGERGRAPLDRYQT